MRGGKKRPASAGAFWNSIPGRRFHPHGRVRSGFLPPSRSQAQYLFHLVQGTIVMASLVSGRAGDPALDGARRSPDVQILWADPIAVEELGERRALGASRMQKSTSECQATLVLWSPRDQSSG